MVLEIAQIEIKPGLEAAFEAGIAEASALFKAAAGCRAFAVERSIEHPSRYRLMIHWDTLPWQAYRALVGHCFAGPVAVEHTEQVLKAF